jgi:hypothetical protein
MEVTYTDAGTPVIEQTVEEYEADLERHVLLRAGSLTGYVNSNIHRPGHPTTRASPLIAQRIARVLARSPVDTPCPRGKAGPSDLRVSLS